MLCRCVLVQVAITCRGHMIPYHALVWDALIRYTGVAHTTYSFSVALLPVVQRVGVTSQVHVAAYSWFEVVNGVISQPVVTCLCFRKSRSQHLMSVGILRRGHDYPGAAHRGQRKAFTPIVVRRDSICNRSVSHLRDAMEVRSLADHRNDLVELSLRRGDVSVPPGFASFVI